MSVINDYRLKLISAPVREVLRWWLFAGIFFLLVGMFLVTKRTGFTIGVYLLLVLPSLILMLMNIGSISKRALQLDVLLPLLLVGYLAVSSLWGDSSLFIDYVKRGISAGLACYGVYFMAKHFQEDFQNSIVCATIFVGGVCAFWFVDFYFLMDNPLSSRFMNGAKDYYAIYQDKHYAAFFNPLRLSHTLTFMFYMCIAILSCFPVRRLSLKWWAIFSALLIIGLMILMAQTRTAWLLSIGAIGLAVIHKYGLKGMVFFALVFLVVFVLFMQLDHSVVNRGLSYRPQLWAAGFKEVEGAWLWGKGLGAPMLLEVEGLKHKFAEAHNVYIMMLFYGGAIAVSLWMALVLHLSLKAIMVSGLSLWFSLWGSLFLLGGMTDGAGLLSRPNEHWFTLVIPLALLYVSIGKEQKKEDEKPLLEKDCLV